MQLVQLAVIDISRASQHARPVTFTGCGEWGRRKGGDFFFLGGREEGGSGLAGGAVQEGGGGAETAADSPSSWRVPFHFTAQTWSRCGDLMQIGGQCVRTEKHI